VLLAGVGGSATASEVAMERLLLLADELDDLFAMIWQQASRCFIHF